MPRPLKLNGKTGWDSTLPILNNERRLDCRYHRNQRIDAEPVEEVAFFKCPRSSCSKVEPSSAKIFQYRDLDRPHECSFCCKSTQVRTWLCPCDRPWHLCDMHRQFHSGKQVHGPQNKPETGPTASAFSRASNAKRKRLRCEDIGDIDAWQENFHKCRRAISSAKRNREVDLNEESASAAKTARVYEIVLSRFKGRNVCAHGSHV